MGEKRDREQALVNEMTKALATGQFVVYYQPEYDLNTNRFCGAEALVRWKHPKSGIVSPGVFIPLFERNGLISKLDAYVWEKVLENIAEWRSKGLDVLPISVNVSRVDLCDPKLLDKLLALTDKYGVPLTYLNLEITESAYSDNPKAVKQTVFELRQAGFTVFMDDFGSGYSSLNILEDIEVDILKIDMRFIFRASENIKSRKILTSIIRMAQILDLPTVAEGVETEQQVQLLKLYGCSYAQGYYYAKPMPIEEYEKNILCGKEGENK